MHSFRHNVIERFHSRGHHHLCKIIGTKESVFIRREFNSHRTGLEHQDGRCFFILKHQYGHCDVMLKLSIVLYETSTFYDKTLSCRYISFMPFNSRHIIFRFLPPSPPPPPGSVFAHLFANFSRDQSEKSRSSVFLCSETKRKRSLHRLNLLLPT